MFSGEGAGENLPGAGAGVSLECYETPWRQLAMVWRAGGDGQQRFNLPGVWSGACHGEGRRRAATAQKLDCLRVWRLLLVHALFSFFSFAFIAIARGRKAGAACAPVDLSAQMREAH
jgi:hypothetical protein